MVGHCLRDIAILVACFALLSNSLLGSKSTQQASQLNLTNIRAMIEACPSVGVDFPQDRESTFSISIR